MIQMRYLRFLMLAVGLILLSACGDQPATPTPAANPTQTAAGAATSPPVSRPTPDEGAIGLSTIIAGATVQGNTPTAQPALTPQATQPATDALSVELEAMLAAELPATPAVPSDGTSIEGVRVIKLQRDGQPLWVAHTFGNRSFDPEQKHYVAIYTYENDKWRMVSRVELESADYLDRESVKQVLIEPSQTWLQVEGGAGAHSGVFQLLRFDGTSLTVEAQNASASPGAGEVRDINGDGMLDVVLDATDAYVFCYACGVRFINFGVMRWDGTKLVPVELAPLDASAPEEARRLNDLAIKETQADLWKAAKENIAKAKTLAPQDETLAWNTALIGLTADARAAHIKDSGHALLTTLFYGDYDAAIASIRQYSPEELFGPQSPLIAGTPAEGNEDLLRMRIIEITNRAIEADPTLAGAYFLRGWARYKVGEASPEATAALTRASELDPNEELYKLSAAYVTKK